MVLSVDVKHGNTYNDNDQKEFCVGSLDFMKGRVVSLTHCTTLVYWQPETFENITIWLQLFHWIKLQLHAAIYRLRFYSNSLIHILSLSNSHNNLASIQKNRGDKSHRVIVALGSFIQLHPWDCWDRLDFMLTLRKGVFYGMLSTIVATA